MFCLSIAMGEDSKVESFARVSFRISAPVGLTLSELAYVLYGNKNKAQEIAKLNTKSSLSPLEGGTQLHLQEGPAGGLGSIEARIIELKKISPKETQQIVKSLSVQFHVTRAKDETLKDVSIRFYGSPHVVGELVRANGLTSPQELNTNQVILPSVPQLSIDLYSRDEITKWQKKEVIQVKPKEVPKIVKEDIQVLPPWEVIQVPEAEREPSSTSKAEAETKPRRPSFLLAGVGLTQRTYKEGTTTDTKARSADIKLWYQNVIWPQVFHVDAQVQMTGVFISNDSTSEIRFLEGSLQVGYALPFVSEPYRLSIMAGGAYSTMFVTGNAFGYDSLLYPQVYPELRRLFKSGDTLTLAVKYMPLSTSGSEQRAMAAQLRWAYPTASGRPLFFDVTYTDTKHSIDTSTTAASTAITINFGMGI